MSRHRGPERSEIRRQTFEDSNLGNVDVIDREPHARAIGGDIRIELRVAMIG
jgi:hypothetical protein